MKARRAWIIAVAAALLTGAQRVWAQTTAGSAAQDLNRASRAELESVRGVGVELAERILLARQEKPFTDWSDAQRRVKGLGKRAMQGFAEAGFEVGGVKARP